MPTLEQVRVLDLPEDQYLAWLAGQSIGGSEIGAVLGVSDWATPADIFDRKLGLVPPGEDNPDMARGRALEAVVADIYAQQTGRTVLRAVERQRDRVHPFLHASPDRMIEPCYDPSEPDIELAPADGPGVLEIKVPRWRGYERVRTDGIQPSYFAQLQQYLHITRSAWGSFAVFNADAWELYWFDVVRDEAFIERLLAEAVQFWNLHMIPRRRPGGRREREPVVMPARVGAEAVWSDAPELVSALAALREVQGEHQLYERRYKDAQERVRQLIGDVEAVNGPGFRLTHRGSTRSSFDVDALAQDHPYLDLAPYRRQSITRPSLRVTFTDGRR